MRAAIRRGPQIVVDEMATPTPGEGQVLVRTLHCGICGSDLHALHNFEAMADYGRRTHIPTGKMDPHKDLVFGHEFCAEVLDYGPGTVRKFATGTAVCSLPATFGPEGVEAIGFSHKANGGFAEYMLLSEKLLFPVTNGLPSEQAALVEPMAVGVHAVAKADTENSVYMVIGCGPVGLSIIAELKSKGLGPVIASDPVRERRKIAETLGADFVVDPTKFDPHSQWRELTAPPRGQRRGRRPVIFECVGAPGMLNKVLEAAPVDSQIIVCGVCMAPDTIEPSLAMNKELDLRFIMAYSPKEFAQTMTRVCEGDLDLSPLISGVIGLDEVPAAFDELLSSPKRVKVLVDPRR